MLKSDMVLASIPCGLIDDLFLLDYSNKENLTFVRIDFDPESINIAKQKIFNNKIVNTKFKIQDAWNLSTLNQYDLITSNGLNICEPSDIKIIELYQEFYNSLRRIIYFKLDGKYFVAKIKCGSN